MLRKDCWAGLNSQSLVPLPVLVPALAQKAVGATVSASGVQSMPARSATSVIELLAACVTVADLEQAARLAQLVGLISDLVKDAGAAADNADPDQRQMTDKDGAEKAEHPAEFEPKEGAMDTTD